MNKLFESALARTNFDAEGGFGAWTPLADVYESPDSIFFCLEVPGVEQKDIDVRLDGDELLVQGERRMGREEDGEQYHRVERSYGKFSRRFALPSNVDRASVAALYRDGLLKVTLRKKDSTAKGPVRVVVQ
jgi:HSP20 family protein